MFTSAVGHRHRSERTWTEHLATTVGAQALLTAVRQAPLPDALTATLDDVLAALAAETTFDATGAPQALPTHQVTHQLHVDGRYPDIVVHDPRDQLFAVVEAQRRRADDKHIAKLATRYVPSSGARLGILVAEGWRPTSARHPAWAVCPAPVVVVVAVDALHEIDYQVAWVHHPPMTDGE